MTSTDVFATTFAALFAAHEVADHWIQTDWQAQNKGRRDGVGRRACAAHVATYTMVGAATLSATKFATGTGPAPVGFVAALAVSAASHFWIDRRFTLAALARRCGKGSFYQLGTPRPGRDDNPTLGTGAYALDQSAHVGMLWVAALLAAAVGQRRAMKGQPRMPDWKPPQLPPPPEDAVALYIRWRAAEEHLAELQRTLPPAGESAVGGVVMPRLDERVVAAGNVASRASIAFHRHEWWYGAFDRSEADRVIGEAARAFGEPS